MAKNTKYKRSARQKSAAARKASLEKMTDEQREEHMEMNKKEYAYWHDGEEHLNGGEREFRREAGLPLNDPS